MNTRRSFIKKSLTGYAFIAGGGISEIFRSVKITAPGNSEKLRLIVETDAGGDPDDEQSLVRFLLYSNIIDIEGIIANRRIARQGENKNPVRDGLGIVRAMINAYGQCYPNLISNDKGYPAPETLLQCTVPGYDDTDEGVNLIINAVDSADPRPVWFSNGVPMTEVLQAALKERWIVCSKNVETRDMPGSKTGCD